MLQYENYNKKLPTRDLNNHLYLYAMPLKERKYLCALLDEKNVYSQLAVKYMGYDKTILQDLQRAMRSGNSPSDKLITLWGDQNHTVVELFFLLKQMNQNRAMEAIKDLVDQRYHRYIPKDERPDLSAFQTKSNDTEHKNLNDTTMEKNINLILIQESEKILNIPSNENNESVAVKKIAMSTSNSVDMNNVDEYASAIPKIDYEELVIATDNWKDENKLGHGGFGTVFKGCWKMTDVAIKRLENRGQSQDNLKIQMQQSLNELRYLNSARHDNILPLYGYSINGSEPCLVYQLMSGGSLEQRLSAKSKYIPLKWRQRLNIAQGTARGLQYLHTFKEKPLIHGDIKPANILLDPCNQPKIGDFGLAREGPNTVNSSVEVSRVYGTKPYLPAEFIGSKSLSTKVDTYSFGVVLYELATGLRAYDHKRPNQFLTKHIAAILLTPNITIDKIMDMSCAGDENGEKTARNLIRLGYICTAEHASLRPEMKDVLMELDKFFM